MAASIPHSEPGSRGALAKRGFSTRSHWLGSVFILLLAASWSSVPCVRAEPPGDDTVTIKSMGFPKIWKPYAGPMLGWGGRDSRTGIVGELNIGLYKDLVNPVLGALGAASESYFRADGDRMDGGVRLLGVSRFFLVQAGADYSFRDGRVRFLMSLTHPLRRGGPFGKGGNFRLDWCPGRTHSVSVGLTIPIGQPAMGKTRARRDFVSLPRGSLPRRPEYVPDSPLREMLEEVRHATIWINQLTTPFLDQYRGTEELEIAEYRDMLQGFKDHFRLQDENHLQGHTFEAEVTSYHRALERAFSMAAGGRNEDSANTTGVRLSSLARTILLDEVIFPYNRLLGRKKKNNSLLGYGKAASEEFASRIEASDAVSAERRAAVMYVFQSLLRFIDQARIDSEKKWEDPRLTWIPLHYGLRFEEHDTEIELDAIIERAVGRQFTDANDVHYVVNELFQPELSRMIAAAEDYHVLWIHDFRGVNSEGAPDAIACQTVQSYLRTLAERVRAYDTTGKIPVYMIFLDQHYYELQKSRIWLELLANPLRHEFDLPGEFEEMEQAVRAAQEDLRTAVAESHALQSAARRHGKQWLTNKIKVHINITNPSDLSFRNEGILKYFSFVPDNIMRDHRKITFYDVTELDPGKGEAMYTGLGIGEHYVGPTWDDRSVLARGPALLDLKTEARELLLTQGFREDEIPAPLRPQPKPENYDELLDALRAQGWTATAIQVHNATGFGPKLVNVVKAVLYNLMPKGSHLYITDSLWNAPFWGSMVLGAALRGCVVLAICPSVENAPSSGTPQMSRANELFARFVFGQTLLKKEIEASGGLFKCGIYTMDMDVGDIVGKLRALNNGIAKSETFQKLFPFSPKVVELVRRMPDVLESDFPTPSYLVEGGAPRKPKLHLKTQFFASAQTINTVVPLEAWLPIVQHYVMLRAQQSAYLETGVDAKAIKAKLKEAVARLYSAWYETVPESERGKAMIYLTVGSHNEDYRSMIMDGEALYVVGHAWALVGYLDMVSLMAQTTWIENLEQLEELLPKHKGFGKWLGRFLKVAL